MATTEARGTQTSAKTGDLSSTTPAEGDSLTAAKAGDVETPTTFEDLTKDELQERLKEVGETVSGNKDELIERLQEAGGADAEGRYPATGKNPFREFAVGQEAEEGETYPPVGKNPFNDFKGAPKDAE